MTEIEIMENEKLCIERNINTNCNRDCKNCDLVLPDDVILSAYDKAIIAIQRDNPKPPKPNKRIPGIGKCQICKTELCIDDDELFFCPTCGQRLKKGTYDHLLKEAQG